MALKLSVSSRSVASAHCSTEDLLESIENVATAAEALYDAGADGQEICQVLDNLTLIASALDNGGLTPEFLRTFNAEGETLEAAGVESLSVAGLEALGESQINRFEDRIAAGLEGKMGEYWAKFVAWLKNMWAKLVNWFKSILVNRARYAKAIKEILDDKNKTWTDKEASVVEYAKVNDAKTAITTAETWLTGEKANVMATGKDGKREVDVSAVDGMIKNLDAIGEAKSEAKKLSAHGWDATKASTIGTDLWKIAIDAKLNKVQRLIDGQFQGLITKAGQAGKLDNADEAKTAKDDVQKKREKLMKVVDLLRNDNRCVMKACGETLKVLKAGYASK